MKFKITVVLVCLMHTLIFSQKTYEKATITFKDGTVKEGLIKFSSTIDPYLVIFKESEQSNVQELTTNQISDYTFQNLKRKISAEKIDEKSQFTEIIVEGKASLLMLMEKRGNKRYFLKSEKSEIKELVEEEQYKGSQKFKLKRYIGLLNLEFNDCNDFSSTINNTKLQLRSLAKTFTEYNTCVNQLTSSSARLKSKGIHKIGIDIGINSIMVNAKISEAPNGNFDSKTTPHFGLIYNYTPNLFSSKLSIETGISYFQYENQRVLSSNLIAQANKIDISAINYRVGLVYNFVNENAKFKPVLQAYFLGSFVSNKQNVYTLINNEQELRFFEDSTLTKHSFGIGTTLGFHYTLFPNNEIILKAGYERVGDYTLSSTQSYPADVVTVRLGYLIKL